MNSLNDEERTTLHSLCGRTVIRAGNNLVVKSGNLRSHEAQTLRFIATNTTIPVPKVHDIHWKDGKVVAIVMDYMPGKRLDEAWDTLDSDQKLSIASEQQFNEFILGDIVKSAPDILRHYAKFGLIDDHEIVLLTPISARVITLSKEAGSQLSLTGNMLAGIRNTGNISRRFGN
jgi:hypothetical protein